MLCSECIHLIFSLIVLLFNYYHFVYLKKCENRPCCTLVAPRPGSTYLESLMDIQAALAKFKWEVTIPELRFACECSYQKERLINFNLLPQYADEQCGVKRELEWRCPERPKKRKAPPQEESDSKPRNKTAIRKDGGGEGSLNPWQETGVMPFDRLDPFYPEREDHYRRHWIDYQGDDDAYDEFGQPYPEDLWDASEALNSEDYEEEEDGAEEISRDENSWYAARCGDPRHKTWCMRFKACTPQPTLMMHMVTG